MIIINKDIKIAIFGEEVNGPLFVNAAKKMGFSPYLFFASEPKNKVDYTYYVLNVFSPSEHLNKKINEIMGEPDAIVSCIEQFSVAIAKFCESIGKLINPIESYSILRDKGKMKKVWKEQGILTAESMIGTSFKDVEYEKIKFPVIVKPTFGAASAGVRIIYDKNELEKQLKQILRFNISTLNEENAQKSGYIIEEYIEGEEYSVDTIWFNGSPIINGIMSKGNPKGPLFPDRLYLIDNNLSQNVENELLRRSHLAVKASGVKCGATHTEVRVRDGKGYIIESAFRPGAGGCFYSLFEKSLGVSFYEALILVSLQKHSDIDLNRIDRLAKKITSPKTRGYWYNMGYEGSGTIKSIEGCNEVKKNEFIDNIIIRKIEGDYLTPECDSYSYLGWIMGEFKNYDEFSNYYNLLMNIERQIRVVYK